MLGGLHWQLAAGAAQLGGTAGVRAGCLYFIVATVRDFRERGVFSLCAPSRQFLIMLADVFRVR